MRNASPSLFLLAGLGFSLNLPLSVKNTVAVARTDVPVQMGIPFPKGKLALADVTKLTVSEEATGLLVPAGVNKTVVWHDGSVRWVRLLFPATLPASATKSFILSDADKNTLGGLTAAAAGNVVTVVTGPLKFTVKGANFNLFDEAWMNEANPGVFDAAHQVIQTGNAGGFYIKVGGTEYKSNTVSATVTLVETSKYHAIVKASGRVGSVYPFVIYYYAYYNKPYVKIVHNFYYDNSSGGSGSQISIADISLRVATKLSGGNASFSNTGGDLTTAVGAAEEGFVRYVSEDAYVVAKGTTQLGSGQGMNQGTQGASEMGWAHMTDGTLGVGGALRFMWQMAPKHISVKGTGEMELHLWSDKGPALTYYGGAGRTHYTAVAFTTSSAVAKEMFYALSQPLHAVAPPKWLTWQSKVWGDLVPVEAANFDPAYTSTAHASAITNQYKMMGFVHGHSNRKTPVDGEDSYGWVEFGDLSDPMESCGSRHWSNNYYDFPHNIAQAFMMTGSEYNLETALAHVTHMGDLDHSNTTGQSRTCPGYGNFGDYTACAIGYSNTSNHYKAMGFFDWSNILGEPILADLGLRVVEWARGYVGGEIRAPAHVLEALVAAYAYTNDANDLADLHGAYTAFGLEGNFSGQPFQQAEIGESFMWDILEEPAYATATSSLQKWADHWSSAYDATGNTFGDYPDLAGGYLGGLGFAATLFPSNRTAYMTVLRDLWTAWAGPIGAAGDGRLKTFTQKFKAPPHFFKEVMKTTVDFSLPDYWAAAAPAVSGVEIKPLAQTSGLLRVQPNPMRQRALISFSTDRLFPKATVEIYDVRGHQVREWKLAGGVQPVLQWDGRDGGGRPLGSGIYMVKLKNGKQYLTEKLSLIR